MARRCRALEKRVVDEQDTFNWEGLETARDSSKLSVGKSDLGLESNR